MKISVLLIISCLMASPSVADIRVEFREGAPKDHFVVTNNGACSFDLAEISIDLSGTSGGLIFDVTDTGLGVEVFQPFEVVSGSEHLARWPEVQDGDRAIALRLIDFGSKDSVVFSIDVDDTIGDRGITVSGNEAQGMIISAKVGAQEFSGMVEDSPDVTLKTSACAS